MFRKAVQPWVEETSPPLCSWKVLCMWARAMLPTGKTWKVRQATRELSLCQDAVIFTSHSPDLTIPVQLDVVQMRPLCVASFSPIFNSSIYNSCPVSHQHCTWGVWEVVGSNHKASVGKITGSDEKAWPRGIDTLRNPGLELAVKWPSKFVFWAPFLSTPGCTNFLNMWENI